MTLQPGLTGKSKLMVESRHTALEVGSGRQRILATPVLVTMMEEAAQNAINNVLPEGIDTIGTRLEIEHASATPVGMLVTATARLVDVQKRTLVFEVEAHDEKEQVGKGVHERAVVSVAAFSRLLARKATGLDVG